MMLYDVFLCMMLYPEGDNAFDHPLLAALPNLQAQRHCVLAGNGNWWAAGWAFVQHYTPCLGKRMYMHGEFMEICVVGFQNRETTSVAPSYEAEHIPRVHHWQSAKLFPRTVVLMQCTRSP